jgi:cation transport ATPase
VARNTSKPETTANEKHAAPSSSVRRELGWPFLAATFLAIVGLQSIPRFLFELEHALPIVQRAVLLGLFLVVAWFFTVSLHERFRWSMLSGLFLVEMAVGVAMAILLFLQLYSVAFVYAGLLVLLVRAGVYSYIASHRLPHLRGLVFSTTLFLLVLGEIVILART